MTTTFNKGDSDSIRVLANGTLIANGSLSPFSIYRTGDGGQFISREHLGKQPKSSRILRSRAQKANNR